MIEKRWSGLVIVAAPGPSLSQDVAGLCQGIRCVAVNDAYKLFPWSDILYAADIRWWKEHQGCLGFAGEKWIPRVKKFGSETQKSVDLYKLNVIDGERVSKFSSNPSKIYLGDPGSGNSGLQACNLSILFGATKILLCGFDMREVDGKKHFFGDHPKSLNPRQNFNGWVKAFENAAKTLPEGVEIINTTRGSALTCFPFMDLQEALQDARRAA